MRQSLRPMLVSCVEAEVAPRCYPQGPILDLVVLHDLEIAALRRIDQGRVKRQQDSQSPQGGLCCLRRFGPWAKERNYSLDGAFVFAVVLLETIATGTKPASTKSAGALHQ